MTSPRCFIFPSVAKLMPFGRSRHLSFTCFGVGGARIAPLERPPVVALENVEDLLSDKDDNFKWPPEFATLVWREVVRHDSDDPRSRATRGHSNSGLLVFKQ
eukprot:6492788-Amphidinium_carterae.2